MALRVAILLYGVSHTWYAVVPMSSRVDIFLYGVPMSSRARDVPHVCLASTRDVLIVGGLPPPPVLSTRQGTAIRTHLFAITYVRDTSRLKKHQHTASDMSNIRADESDSESDGEYAAAQTGPEAESRSGSACFEQKETWNTFPTQEMTSGTITGGSHDPMDLMDTLGSENRAPNVRTPASGSGSDRTSTFKVPKMHPNPAWDDHLRVWLSDKAQGTQRKYLRGIRALRAYVGDMPPEQISLPTLREFRAYIMAEAPERSRRDYLISVRSFFIFLYESQIITRNHGRGIKIPPKCVTIGAERALSRQEVQRILEHATHMDKYLFATMYYAGLRIEEVVQLTPERVTRRGERLVLSVYGKGSKTREIQMGLTGSSILREWINLQRIPQPLFQISTRQIRRRLKNIVKAAGLSPNISPHWLRHAFATHAYEAGVQIVALSKVLGHASTKTTMQYIHCNSEQVGAALD